MAETEWTITTRTPAETQALARTLGAQCQGGEVLGLVGDLGTGKTCFTQGLALGLGVPERAYVCSPTFTLVNVHRGRLTLHHVDLYRLAEADEATHIGYEDLFQPEAVVVIEWFERFPELWPRSFLQIGLGDLGGETRRVDVTAHGPEAATWLSRWRSRWGAGEVPA
jgi:tRNA threonylcarbamoyladenosine biosynthesis protein TsaE